MGERHIQEETDPFNCLFGGIFQYIPPVLSTLTKSCISVSLLQGQDTPLPLTSIFHLELGHRMLHRVLGAAKAWNSLWSSNPTFPALPNVTAHTGQAPHQFLCPPGGKGAHKHHFGLVLPLRVTFKSDFLSSLSLWMTRYSESLEGEEVIKRNSANLFYFLSLLDNLFICSHLTRCRQTYFPMDRVNPSPKVSTCTWISSPRAFQIHIAKCPWSFGVSRAISSTHRCKHIKCQCLLPHTAFAFLGVSVAMGTQGTLARISPSTEVCSFTETQPTSTYILQFDPSVDKF